MGCRRVSPATACWNGRHSAAGSTAWTHPTPTDVCDGLFGRLGLALRSLDDARREIRRGDDLQHLEVLRAGNLAMLDARRLEDGIALADRALALTFVLEDRPAVHHVHELECAVVDVPLLHLVLH